MTKDKRFMEKPKYAIGDIIVYRDRYEKDMAHFHQSKIIEAIGYLEENDPEDTIGWFYTTEETKESDADSLSDSDILYRLK